MKRVFFVIAMVVSLATVQLPNADAADHPPELIELLNAIDIVPTQESLVLVGSGEDGAALEAIVLDPELRRYTRVRAVFATELFPESFDAEFFAQLAEQNSEDVEVRIAAVAVISRDERAASALICDALLAELLQDPESEIVQAVIRATRRLSDERAGQIVSHGLELQAELPVETQELLIERAGELGTR